MESILQNSLISGYVAQEQKRLQEKQRRRSVDVEQPKHPEPSLLAELRLKEQILREREQALKEREQRLERKSVLLGLFTSVSGDQITVGHTEMFNPR